MGVLRVGVVEDNDLDFYALRRGLAARRLSRWVDGQDLLRALKEDPGLLAGVDVLLLDLGLPVTDGVQVARTVRALGGNELSIIVLCGALPPPAITRQLEEVIDEIRIKPANRRDLAALNDRLDELTAVLEVCDGALPVSRVQNLATLSVGGGVAGLLPREARQRQPHRPRKHGLLVKWPNQRVCDQLGRLTRLTDVTGVFGGAGVC